MEAEAMQEQGESGIDPRSTEAWAKLRPVVRLDVTGLPTATSVCNAPIVMARMASIVDGRFPSPPTPEGGLPPGDGC
jgi:hypothetical protein